MLDAGLEVVLTQDILALCTTALVQIAERLVWLRRRATHGRGEVGAHNFVLAPENNYRAESNYLAESASQEEHKEFTQSDYSVTSPVPREQWQAIYASDPTNSVHQSPRWIEHLCVTASYEDVTRLYELANGKRLVLPLVKRRGIPDPLAFVESLPNAWGIGGLLSTHPLEAADIAIVVEDLKRAGYLSVTIRPNPLQGDAWTTARHAATAIVPRCAHVLDLSGGFEEVWAMRFSKSKRKQVRRAERAGLHVECDTTGRLMPVFYELYKKSVVRWAGQQHEPLWLARMRANSRDPLHKLQAMANFLGDKCRVWVAWHEGQPAAALVTLQDYNASPILAAMDKELATRTYASSLTERLAIEDACNAGCRYYDFGETGFNDRLAYNKMSYGAETVPYADYHIERLPLAQLELSVRGVVKRLIGFKDV